MNSAPRCFDETTMPIASQKEQAAQAALDYIQPGDVVGIGAGSTVNCFIDALALIKSKIDGAVASSEATADRLRTHRIPILDLGQVGALPVCVDGADEATRHLHLIKGGGGALTREKIVAQASEKFVCIADQGKLVDRLGAFPLPVEVIPMAQSMVAREMFKFGGQPVLRTDFVTDNGNVILDIRNLDIENPVDMERRMNQIPGVVTVGLFALRGADVLLLGTDSGIRKLG